MFTRIKHFLWLSITCTQTIYFNFRQFILKLLRAYHFQQASSKCPSVVPSVLHLEIPPLWRPLITIPWCVWAEEPLERTTSKQYKRGSPSTSFSRIRDIQAKVPKYKTSSNTLQPILTTCKKIFSIYLPKRLSFIYQHNKKGTVPFILCS